MRRFITAALFGLACSTTLAATPAKPADDHVALQLYTLRNVGSLEDQLALAEQTGFRAVEVVGDQGVGAEELKAALARHHLQVTSAHVQLDALRDQFDATLAFNKAIGNRVLVVPYVQPAQRPTDAKGWTALGRELDRLGARVRQQGFQLAYHNHDFEMKVYDGRTGYDWMVAATRPENLKLEVDVAWVFRGGQNPAQLVRQYRARLFALHAKDTAGIGVRNDEMNFAPFGEGLIDWPPLLAAARGNGQLWYIVEHDLPKDPRAIIETARRNLLAALHRPQKAAAGAAASGS